MGVSMPYQYGYMLNASSPNGPSANDLQST